MGKEQKPGSAERDTVEDRTNRSCIERCLRGCPNMYK